MQLNRHGWGLRQMIIISGILMLFLAVAIFYIYTLYDSLDKEMFVNSYSKLEDNLESQARIYLSDYFQSTLTDSDIIISRNTLKSYNLDVSLIDQNGNSCSGYVAANINRVKAYIKCQNYETEGYENWRK